MLLIQHRDTYPAERAYVLDVVLGEFLGLEWQAQPKSTGRLEIALAGQPEAGRLFVADELFATSERDWLTARSLPGRPLHRWDSSHESIAPRLVAPELPVLYGTRLARGALLEQTPNRISIGIDLLGAIFFQLTRYEEIARPVRDEHERFPASASLAQQEGFLTRPLVNEYVELLRSAIEALWPRLRTRRRSFSQRLSHDVDWPTHARTSLAGVAKAMAGDLVRRRDPGLVPARLRALHSQRRNKPTSDPYYSFDFIMDLSEQRDVTSAFYFIAGTTDPRFDSAYSIDAPWIGKLIRRIHDRGHEIGLHPSYGTFRSSAAIRAERNALLHACERAGVSQASWGGRQHFLRWENPLTWRAWEQAGLSYDSSLGYPRDPGFRCGSCFEYPVFDLLERRKLALRERPLVLMEMPLVDRHPHHDGTSLQTIHTLRERCRMFGGDFTLLWHNSRLASRRERRLYTAAWSREPKPPA